MVVGVVEEGEGREAAAPAKGRVGSAVQGTTDGTKGLAAAFYEQRGGAPRPYFWKELGCHIK